MPKIPEFVYRRDLKLIADYKLRYPIDPLIGPNSRYDAFARAVAQDVETPAEWRCYFYRGEELLAVLSPLDLRAVVGIRRIEIEHDHENGEEEEIVVFGVREGGFVFRTGVCTQTFGFLMSRFAAANAMDYGFLPARLEPENVEEEIQHWLRVARNGPQKALVLNVDTGEMKLI